LSPAAHDRGDSGPVNLELLHGERAAVGISLKVGRRGRSKIEVRVVGAASLAWIEAAHLWGAKVQAVVMDNSELNEY
jgi:hypothetical protein